MPRLIMSDAEIMDYYKGAVNKDKAIDALAVKLRTDRAGMRDKLRELGLAADEPAPEKKTLDGFKPVAARHGHSKKIDDARARALYHEGKTDGEIAAVCGVSATSVFSWRKKNGLAAKHKRGFPNGPDMKKLKEKAGESVKSHMSEFYMKDSTVATTTTDEEPKAAVIAAPNEAPAQVEPRPAGRFRLETPVKVAKEAEGMTVSQLAGLFEHLSQERGSSVHVCVDGHAIREVEVTLRYRGDSSGPAEMAVELVV